MGEVLFPRVVQKLTFPLLVDPIFANNTWEDIIRACQQNKVPDAWAVGSQKNMVINGKEYAIDIIGKNHDAYADGSGFAPLTFQLHDCYTKYAMNNTNTNVGGWGESAMRNTNMPKILALMPPVVREGIREVHKLTSDGTIEIVTTADKLFLLSEVEIFGTDTWAERGEGRRYEFYKTGGNAVKMLNGVAADWWVRSPNKDNTKFFCGVTPTGESAYYTTSSLFGVAPAFCF